MVGFGDLAGPSLCLTVVRVEGVGFDVKEEERIGFGGVAGAILAYVGIGMGIEEGRVGFVVGVSAEWKGVWFGVLTGAITRVGEDGACVGTVSTTAGIGVSPANLVGVSPIGVGAAADVESEEVLRTAALVTLLLPVPS